MLTVIPPAKLVLVLLSSSSSFTGETVTCPCLQGKRWAERREAAPSAPSHSLLAIIPDFLSILVLPGCNRALSVSGAEG